HLALGVAALAVGLTVRDVPRRGSAPWGGPRPAGSRWPPAALRTREFWLGVALPAPFVFGTMALAIVVLPEEVTSAGALSAGYAGLMTALAFGAGIGVQPAARRLAARWPRAGIVAGLGAATAGSAAGAAAVAGPSQALAALGAVLLGLAYGLAWSAACTTPSGWPGPAIAAQYSRPTTWSPTSASRPPTGWTA